MLCSYYHRNLALGQSARLGSPAPHTHTVYQGDHTSASGKTRGGGVCVYVNNRWCVDVRVFGKYCSVDIEFLMVKCRPIYLPREFSTVFLLAVFILPEADHMTTLGILHGFISR